MNMITQSRLKELLLYDKTTGIFTRLVANSNCIRVGGVVDSMNTGGYLRIFIDGKRYLLHRLVFLYLHGSFPPDEVDHINGIKHDNRRSNLRRCNHSTNMKNQSTPTNNKSGSVGVHWNKREKKWRAQIGLCGKRIQIGSFHNKGEAIAAREEAEIKHNFHKNHGKPADPQTLK